MATWYLDPVSGNDSNAGTSWGAAFKTFATGPTAAKGVLAGDTIRCAKSPAPVSIGDATWTSRKVSNSITFASPITKTVDLCKAGWVTLGAGSVVTNGQGTAAVTETVFGTGSGPGALQVVTTAVSALAYKPLGAVTDFSAYQQVSFWFRPTATFDCTGAQNMFLNLCSDALGVTAVNSLAFPKWNYIANTWYPIVIDAGVALGSSIQSVAIRTTSATSSTWYFDEIFASPAAGVTLWSLLGDNDSAWYQIKTCRGADVQLFAGYSPSTASGAAIYLPTGLSSSWVGTTGTFTTYKRETLKAFSAMGQTSPTASSTFCAPLFAGTWNGTSKQLVTFSFGWNTSSGLQDDVTYVDGLVGLYTAFSGAFANSRVENLVAVRCLIGFTSSTTLDFNNIGAIGCTSTSMQVTASWMPGSTALNVPKTYTILPCTGNSGALGFTASTSGSGLTITYGKQWGNPLGMNLSSLQQSTVNFGTLANGGSGQNQFTSGAGNGNTINVTQVEQPAYASNPNGASGTACIYNSNDAETFNIGTVLTNAGPVLYCNTPFANGILDIGTLNGSGWVLGGASNSAFGNTACRVLTNNSTSVFPCGNANQMVNDKAMFHDWSGPGYARVLSGFGSSTPNIWDLQTGDVHTVGSKAWKFTLNSTPSYQTIGYVNDLKLASVAAVADKLVTVTCYVKQSAATTYQLAGIKVPAVFLPGYTSAITATLSGSTGTWYQLTLTFTPTADCVFDVLAWTQLNDFAIGGSVVWDDLSITQAA
jgi:hypothetical protein